MERIIFFRRISKVDVNHFLRFLSLLTLKNIHRRIEEERTIIVKTNDKMSSRKSKTTSQKDVSAETTTDAFAAEGHKKWTQKRKFSQLTSLMNHTSL